MPRTAYEFEPLSGLEVYADIEQLLLLDHQAAKRFSDVQLHPVNFWNDISQAKLDRSAYVVYKVTGKWLKLSEEILRKQATYMSGLEESLRDMYHSSGNLTTPSLDSYIRFASRHLTTVSKPNLQAFEGHLKTTYALLRKAFDHVCQRIKAGDDWNELGRRTIRFNDTWIVGSLGNDDAFESWLRKAETKLNRLEKVTSTHFQAYYDIIEKTIPHAKEAEERARKSFGRS